MRKSEWVEKGLIVVISIRDLSESRFNTNSADIKIGDIIRIMDNRLYGKLKKMENVNPVLFTDIENTNDAEISRRLFAIQQGELQDDDIFDRGGSEGEGEGEDDEEGEGEGQSEDAKLAKALAMKEKQKTRDVQLASGRNVKRPSESQGQGQEEDNLDIDDL